MLFVSLVPSQWPIRMLLQRLPAFPRYGCADIRRASLNAAKSVWWTLATTAAGRGVVQHFVVALHEGSPRLSRAVSDGVSALARVSKTPCERRYKAVSSRACRIALELVRAVAQAIVAAIDDRLHNAEAPPCALWWSQSCDDMQTLSSEASDAIGTALSATSSPTRIDSLALSSVPTGSLSLHDRRNSLPPLWIIDEEQIFCQEKIGDGQFGEVFKAQLWGTDVAVKQLKKVDLDDSFSESLIEEVDILSRLRHPNVVLYIGACTTPNNACIVTEWCSGGSLYDFLHRRDEPLPFADIVDIAQGIAQGMNYLHSLGGQVIHRDLKSANVLLTRDRVPKVCDFGLSHVREFIGAPGEVADASEGEPVGQYGVVGTPEWMAPEVMEGDKYGSKVDVYSFGIVLTELLTRQMPFHDRYQISSFLDVVKAVLDDGAVPTIPEWCGTEMQLLIERCLSRLPAERPSFEDIISDLRVLNAYRSEFFVTMDIPRLIHMLGSADMATCALAAKEIAGLGVGIEIPPGQTVVMVARAADLLRDGENSHDEDRRLLAKAMLTLVETADTRTWPSIGGILRDSERLKTIQRFVRAEQSTEIGIKMSRMVSLLIRDLPINDKADFVDVGSFEIAGGFCNGLEVLPEMACSFEIAGGFCNGLEVLPEMASSELNLVETNNFKRRLGVV